MSSKPARTDLGETVTLVGTDGSQVIVALRGGHVVSWRTADGRERLFVSSLATIEGDAAIRGGIPVCFPQFAAFGPLRKHGFARTARWSFIAGGRFVCTVNKGEWPGWPHACTLTLDVDLGPSTLFVGLTVENRGVDVFSFTGALHTYLGCDDISLVKVTGLEGSAVHGGGLVDGPIGFGDGSGDVDLCVLDARRSVSVTGLAGSSPVSTTMICAQTGFCDVVVWNVGSKLGNEMADLGPGEWRSYVCVEAATAGRSVVLAPGTRWRASQVLVAQQL